MTIAPFTSDTQLISFARDFFKDRVGSFRKDIAICLKANANRSHAYFPALITCIGFADFLSGLYAGKLDGHSLNDLKQYAKQFMDGVKYDPERLEILYLAFRHKLAHLSFPLAVFDTATRKEFRSRKHRLVTWRVNATKRNPPIQLIDHVPARFLKRRQPPWAVKYDCRVIISVRSFETDIVKSIYGKTGYLHHLQNDARAREHFAKCMKVIFPL
jgi:hypothetical protein